MKNSSTQQLKECKGYTTSHPAIMGEIVTTTILLTQHTDSETHTSVTVKEWTVGVVGSDT